jgi:type I restriction enzyme R subunit
LANQFKDAKNPFKIVIAREGESPRRSWLTGFDAPCLHTMYAAKPMQGHGLMQAVTLVNRVIRDKSNDQLPDCREFKSLASWAPSTSGH